jgi:hypothetical protein
MLGLFLGACPAMPNALLVTLYNIEKPPALSESVGKLSESRLRCPVRVLCRLKHNDACRSVGCMTRIPQLMN